MVEISGLTVVACSLAAGVGSVGLVRYLARHRGHSGVGWFMAALTLQGLAAFGYGIGLLISDPLWRGYAEATMWIGLAWIGPLFLGFALEYTGKARVVRSWVFRALFLAPVVTTGLALTHPAHSLLWSDFRIVPLSELSTVLYTVQPWGFAVIGICIATAGVAVLLLLETIVAYGPLYRRETISVALSTVPPTVGLSVWLAGIGPWPQLNLAVLFLLPHVVLDAYAFVGTQMFETNPTTQRAAERSALHDLRDPMLTVDTDGQVVNLNERAKALFGIEADELPIPLEALTGTSLEAMRNAGEITLGGADGGAFAVSYTSLTDPRDDRVGGMIVLYDVTEERQRKQQLAVFNRVLRHNLRNEMTVVRGHAEMIASETADPQRESQADAIVGSSQRLLSIADKAKQFDRIKGRERRMTEIHIPELLGEIERELRESRPNARVETEVAAESERLRSDSELLSLLVSNLLENAVVHAEGDEPTVRVRLSAGEGSNTVIEIEDGNPRIAELEIETIRAGDETPLQHGSGIGLWIVKWCVTRLNGELEFGYDDGNVVTVTLPSAGTDS